MTTLEISVPPTQAIRAGWKLLVFGLWYYITRRDMWISTYFEDKNGSR